MSSPHDRQSNPCDDYVELLVRAADDSLDPDMRARLDAHVAHCEGCRVALDTQRLAHTMVAAAFEVDAPLGFSTRVVAHIESPESWLDRLDFRRWTWRVSPVAAGLFLAAWVVAGRSEATSASGSIDVVNGTDTDERRVAVLLSDAVDQTDLVSLLWNAEVTGLSAAESSEETPQ